MDVSVAADHAGVDLNTRLAAWLIAEGHIVRDLGTDGTAPVEHPDLAEAIGRTVASGQAERGILVCGSGVGASVGANKITGVRGSLCNDTYSAHQSVEDGDINVLILGGRVNGPALVRELVGVFLRTQFSGETRHVRRLANIDRLEEQGR